METNNWNRYIKNESMPTEGERCLISDGIIETIARYHLSDNHIVWHFDCESFKDMNIDWYMELPKLPPIVNKEIL